MADNKTVDPLDMPEDEKPVSSVKLDRTRSFGTTAGEPVKRYFQDGKYFDYADNLVEE